MSITYGNIRRGARILAMGTCVALVAMLFTPTAASSASPSFHAVGSVGQVYVTGLAPSEQVALVRRSGKTLYTQAANALGGVLFRNVPPAKGYRVRRLSDGQTSDALTVHRDRAKPWDPEIYNQTIPGNGYTYLTTRDGTQLAIDVHLPTTGGAAPYPTLIEYAGYAYADPSGPQSGLAIIANLMGFAVVDVNMRGTGCSGGAFDYFEPLQNLDGYDVIETIAHQPWVRDHKVGMMGISYGGISQLFTAQLNPPDLEAISPLSTIDATATTLYPGGILNTGFAVPWAQGRQADAKPAGPNTGQPYAYKRIQGGDTTCANNQVLHPEATDLSAKIAANSHYVPAVADPLDPVTFVDKIKAPVFMACQWQDEQTGGHCAELVRHFTGTTKKWFTFTNGAHIDSLDPATANRWFDFLQLFVAHQAPMQNAALIRAAAPVIYRAAMGLPQSDVVSLPVDPIQQIPTYDAALAAFEQLPPVRVLFDNGAGASPTGVSNPGDPYAAFESSFASLPVPGTVARSWYFGPNGSLTDQAPATSNVGAFVADATAVPLTDYASNTGTGGLWSNAAQWQWQWQQPPSGTSVSFVSAPLADNTTVIGSGAVNLWVRSSTPDVDLQATITEVRPDGNETFVQNGWIRASERKLSTNTRNMFKRRSTALEPVPTFTAADASPMPAGQFVKVVVPLYYEGHAYRAGSRIRVTISAPNGTQPVWSFSQTQPGGTDSVSIVSSPSMPSSLILPVVPGVNVPTGFPACPSLRNEPCRPYQSS